MKKVTADIFAVMLFVFLSLFVILLQNAVQNQARIELSKVLLSEGKTKGEIEELEQATLHIVVSQEKGSFKVTVGGQPVTLEDLPRAVEKAAAKGARMVLTEYDKEMPYQVHRTILDICMRAGLTEVYDAYIRKEV